MRFVQFYISVLPTSPALGQTHRAISIKGYRVNKTLSPGPIIKESVQQNGD